MFEAILILHVLIAIAVVVLVLLNQGKGADMGPAFGSGASSTVFGSRGAASFMTRLIAVLGTVFFATSLGLAILAARDIEDTASVIGEEPTPTEEAEDAPEAPDDPERDVPAAPAEEPSESPAAPAPAEDPEE